MLDAAATQGEGSDETRTTIHEQAQQRCSGVVFVFVLVSLSLLQKSTLNGSNHFTMYHALLEIYAVL